MIPYCSSELDQGGRPFLSRKPVVECRLFEGGAVPSGKVLPFRQDLKTDC